jgi:hypothetical protein
MEIKDSKIKDSNLTNYNEDYREGNKNDIELIELEYELI